MGAETTGTTTAVGASAVLEGGGGRSAATVAGVGTVVPERDGQTKKYVTADETAAQRNATSTRVR